MFTVTFLLRAAIFQGGYGATSSSPDKGKIMPGDCKKEMFAEVRKEVNFVKVGGGRCHFDMMLEENFFLIEKLKGIIKRMFGDKIKILVLFYFIHRWRSLAFTNTFLTSTKEFLNVVCMTRTLIKFYNEKIRDFLIFTINFLELSNFHLIIF